MKCPYCGHEHEEKVCPKCYAEMPVKKKSKPNKDAKDSKEE